MRVKYAGKVVESKNSIRDLVAIATVIYLGLLFSYPRKHMAVQFVQWSVFVPSVTKQSRGRERWPFPVHFREQWMLDEVGCICPPIPIVSLIHDL